MADLAKVHQALTQRGFTQSATQLSDWLQYDGNLHCDKQDVPASILISDTDFIHLPIVRLKKRPVILPKTSAHLLGPDNVLCYGLSAINHIDPYKAHEQILGCISSAEFTLNKLLRGAALDETRGEFLSYWNGEHVLIDAPKNEEKHLNVWTIDCPIEKNAPNFLVTGNSLSPQEKFGKAKITLKSSTIVARIIDCNFQPRAMPENWPPENLKEFLLWLGTSSKEAKKRFHSALLAIFDKQSQGGVFIFRNPYHWFGVLVDTAQAGLFGYEKSNRKHARDKWLNSLLDKRAERSSIIRLSPVRIDDTFIIERNLDNQTSLMGKTIVLIGCGTIGGYLADLLVRSGAGFDGGKLILIDEDILLPGNLGRHLLGFDDLFRDKVTAIKEYLEHKNPGVIVEAVASDFRKFPLEITELVIDATGEEPVHHYLNMKQQVGLVPDILYTWIVGAGRAAQCFLSDGTGGCYRCLFHAPTTLNPKFSPLKQPDDPVILGQGCDDHHIPFSCAASTQAASLAIQQVLDWSSGKPSFRLRTRLVTSENTKRIRDCNPKRTKNCPACDNSISLN